MSTNHTEQPLIQVKHLDKSFGSLKVLKDVTVDIYKGDVVCVIGASGSGKSTFLRCLNLLEVPTSGEIWFEGEDMLQAKPARLREIRGSKISVIFQDPMTSLNPVYSVGDQIAEVIHQHEKCSKEEGRRKAGDMLEMVGIPRARYDEYPHQFSGGMKQRVVIAIALACRPDLIIADEPTTALDVTIQAQILEMMKELQRKFGSAIMLITHDFGVVAEICDRCMVVYAGEKIEEGSLEDIFDHREHPYTKGLFDSLPNLQDDSPRLKPIPGLMSNPMDLPSYCSFYDRCSVKCDSCKNSNPKLIEITPGHTVACSRIAQAQKEAK